MSMILANAYIPIAKTTPAMQFALLVFIIGFEGWYLIGKTQSEYPIKFFWKIAAANVITAIIGLGILLPASGIEAWLLFGWGSLYHKQKLLWWAGCIIYGLILPFLIWWICYIISWRIEWFLIKRWELLRDIEQSQRAVILAHRYSYAVLAIIVLFQCSRYWYDFIVY